MWQLISRLQALLSAKERRLAYGVLGLIILAGFIDALGVTSILPFMSVVANPGIIQTNSWLHTLFVRLDFESTHTFLLALGVGALIAVVMSNAISLASSTAILWFSYNLGHSLSSQMLKSYVNQPYSYFLKRNSSDLVVNCSDDVTRVTQGIIVPFLQAIAKAIVAMSILLVVMWIDPWLVLCFGTMMAGVYLIIFLNIRQKVSALGAAGKGAYRKRYRLATEILNGIKELKILGQDKAYQERFAKYSSIYTTNQWMSGALSAVPRHAIESIAFGSMILLVLYLLTTHQDFQKAFPLIALYAFAAYRLLPAFQQMFGSATTIQFNMSSLEAVEDKLGTLVRRQAIEVPSKRHINEAIRPLRKQIELKGLVFQYAHAPAPAINDLSLTIPRHTTVALVGSTGSGKTTLVDIVLGLLEPQSGSLLVDGVPITSGNVASWQQHLGYVPQHIYLSDDTIAANIAFGVALNDLNMDRVKHAAQIAHIHEFIVGELPDGYKTMVGERGVRLSGGQRQRIGIARALYSDPEILILDEATSALDSLTEDAVTESIQAIFHTKTIIMIAHRLRTVRRADVIYLLENGSIIDQGSYKALVGRNDRFKLMAKEGIQV